MATAKAGDGVKVHYTGKLNDGTVFDSSDGREPLAFNLGDGMVIPGFEEGIIGMSIGDKKTINIPMDKAYGPYHDGMTDVVKKSDLPKDFEPQLGMQVRAQTDDGRPIIVTISEIADDTITLDGNHPLAGKDLTFDLELVEIGEPIVMNSGCSGDCDGNCENGGEGGCCN